MAEAKRTVWEVTGETLREIGVLWAVFFMLDDLMDGSENFSIGVKLMVLAGSILVVGLGVYFECRTGSGE